MLADDLREAIGEIVSDAICGGEHAINWRGWCDRCSGPTDTIGDEILDMIAKRGLRIVPAEQWQPIETCPKDGTHFLAMEGEDMYRAEFYYTDDEGQSFFTSHCGQYVSLGPEPTHWMPLPEPPVKP